jgi:hypothetical protein
MLPMADHPSEPLRLKFCSGTRGRRNGSRTKKKRNKTQPNVDPEVSEEHLAEPLKVTVPLFGVTLTTPIIDGYLLIMIQDPEHARKTLRNNTRSGAGLLQIGDAVLAYETLLRFLKIDNHGLALSDLIDGDKQNDGAALRLFHSLALAALVYRNKIREGMEGVFAILFIFGKQEPYPRLDTVPMLNHCHK